MGFERNYQVKILSNQINISRSYTSITASQLLDVLGQLTGGVAHDFNNLLMIISGSLYTLKKALVTIPNISGRYRRSKGATKRGASLTSQLLTFARRQSVNPQVIDVAERIDAVREVLDTGVGSAVTLQFDVAPGCLADHGRRHRIRNGAGQSRHQRARRHDRPAASSRYPAR